MENFTIITQAQIKELLHYNPETGLFTWIKSRGCVKSGDIAGTAHNGYIEIKIYRKSYKAHRLAWMYMTGEFPRDQIDHVKHVRNDNRWAMLRPATDQTNSKNRSLRSDNTSGLPGVTWHKNHKAWQAYIKGGEKITHLGYFNDKFEAVCARMSANNKYSFHENHGR